jgi:AI-2 transport protein TqsA
VSTAPSARALPPAGAPRAVVVLVGLAAAVVVVAGMKAAASLVGPVMLALVLTIAVHPLRRVLDRRMPSWLSTVICLVVVIVVIVGLAVALVVAMARFATLLPEYADEFAGKVDDLLSPLRNAGVAPEHVQPMASGLDLSRLAGAATDALSGVFGVLSGLALVITLVVFMAVDGSSFPKLLAVTAEHRPELVAALTEFARATCRYLVVSTVFGLIVAVLDTIALVLLDVPAPLLWGLLAFLTNYIPNIGFVIGLIPPAVLALLEGGPSLMLAVIAIYCVLNLVIQSFIQPRVVGGSVGIGTTLTFLSLVFWTWVIGPMGAVLAIPLSLLARAILVDADPANRWLVPLVANRAPR